MAPEREGEFARIRDIVAGLPAGERVIVGPGDDAAVLRPREGFDLVVTTDAFVEGVHWREGLLPPEGVGRRLAAANLSDIAAMGARPLWAVIACAAPAAADAAVLRAIEHACAAAFAAEGAAVVGGNLTSTSGPASFTVTLIGEVARDRAWRRAGARPGDVLAVTGSPGRTAAVLALALREGGSIAGVPVELAATYAAPPCRVRAAAAMAAAGGVRAALDISDGLAGDLAHLCAASGVGARVDDACWPADAALAEAAARLAPDATLERAWPLGPGDDYELLLAIAPEAFAACAAAAAREGAALTAIGEILPADAGLVLRASGRDVPLVVRGWDHFA